MRWDRRAFDWLFHGAGRFTGSLEQDGYLLRRS